MGPERGDAEGGRTEETAGRSATAVSSDGEVSVCPTDIGVEVVRRDGKASIARLAGTTVTPGELSGDGKKLVGFTECRVRVWGLYCGQRA